MSAALKTIPMYPVPENEQQSTVNDVQENYSTGFISLFRSIRKHWIWADPVKFQWWVDILLQVNHEEKKVLIENKVYTCGRGECVMSILTWAKRWRTSRGSVRRFLDLLQSEGMIDKKTDTKTTHITVCNYDSYQGYRPTNGTTNGHQTDNRRYTNNNDNNYNNRERGAAKPPASPSFKNISDEDFRNELSAHLAKYGKETLNAFYKYWSEKSASGKMRFQLQQTWETKKRIESWARREGIKETAKNTPPPTSTAPPLKTLADFQTTGK